MKELKWIKLYCLIIFFSCHVSQEEKDINSKGESRDILEKEEDYSSRHKIDKDAFPIIFSAKYQKSAWLYSNSIWKYSKTKLKGLAEVTDSMMIHANYDALEKRREKKKGSKGKVEAVEVEKGEVIFAVNRRSLKKYFAIKILDVERGKVKIAYKLYETDQIYFERFNEWQAIDYIMKTGDLKVLKKLYKSNPAAITKCGNHQNKTRNLLMWSIEKSDVKLFDELLKLDININISCIEALPPLLYACKKSKVYFVEKLLAKDSGIMTKDQEYYRDSALECIKKRRDTKHLLKK